MDNFRVAYILILNVEVLILKAFRKVLSMDNIRAVYIWY